MNTANEAADPAVLAYREAPERLMTFAEDGHLSKYALASVLEPDTRHQFLEACAQLEKQFTEQCAAKGDFCLEDGCAMDGEVCLQALLKAGSEYQRAIAAQWIRMFRNEENRIAGWRD